MRRSHRFSYLCRRKKPFWHEQKHTYYMRSNFYLTLAAGSLLLASCSKLGELSADNFTVTPSPLEAVGGKVPVTINGTFPEKYMKKNAVVTVTPELRSATSTETGKSATFQGEKVQGNDQEISYKLGGSYTMKSTFGYTPAMERSELYLKFAARVGKKEVKVPEVKVADGVLATSSLVSKTAASANTALGEDTYQYAVKQTKKAQIKYLIQQANIRNSELKTTSVQEFVQTLRDIKADQKGLMLDNIEVSAYASPDGGLKLNKTLAEQREKSSSQYVGKQLKSLNLNTDVDTRYTAQDWEGFQELVQASNMQDKDVILRVLSMYQDPEERETQIRNLSKGFGELADEILPELRRARLTINYNLIGRTDDEIQEQYKADPTKLSVEELLYAATLTERTAEQQDIYATAAKQNPSDYRAFNNLATLAFAKGDTQTAKQQLEKAASLKSDAPEVNANRALLALTEGDATTAQNYLAQATAAKNYNEVLGNLQVATGNYAQAAQSLKGTNTNSAALAQILSKDYASAAKSLSGVALPDAYTDYLKAVLAARTSRSKDALTSLKAAIAKDSTLKDYASKDLEFVSLFNDTDFLNLVK